MTTTRISGAMLLVWTVCCAPAFAQLFSWTGGGNSNNWSEAANWGGVVPTSGSADLLFAGSSNHLPFNNLGTFDLHLLFLAGTTPYQISGNALRFSAATPELTASGTTHVINNAVIVSQPLEVQVNSSATLNLLGNLSGAADITKINGGLLVLGGDNGSWSGDLDIQAGTVRFNPGDALSVNSDLHVAAGATADFSPQGEGFGGFSGEGLLQFGNTVDIFSHFNDAMTFSGTISGSNTHLRKQGPGSLILDGLTGGPASVSIDRLTLQDGSVTLNGNAELNLSGALTLQSGTTLSALPGVLNLTSNNPVTVGDGAALRVGSSSLGPANISITEGGTFEVLGTTIEGGTFDIATADGLVFETGRKLTLQNGAMGTMGGTMPLALSLFAELEIQGSGTSWSGPGFLVGDFGTGALTVSAGGSISTSNEAEIGEREGSTGTATVTGAGSMWDHDGFLRVGDSGTGTLLISDGGSVISSAGRVGDNTGSTGSVVVDGAGSSWSSSGQIFLGNISSGILGGNATGSLMITNGAAVSDTNSLVGAFTGTTGVATVTGAGSTWIHSGQLRVGEGGSGAVTIADGGTVSNTDGIVGFFSTSNGTVTVTGAGSIWSVSELLSVGGDAVFANGNGGTGTVNIESGAAVDVAQDIVLFPDGLVRLNGGTLSAAKVTFDGGGQFAFLAGTLHVDEFDGDLTVPTEGRLAPGRSAGSTTVLGDYTQEIGSTLEIEIGGTTAESEYDLVNVMGTALLVGDLDLTLINDFVPSDSDVFVIFDATTDLLGFFSNAGNGQRIGTTDGLGSFVVHYGPISTFAPTRIVLTDFEPGIPGDFDADGDVDGLDFLKWQRGESPNPLSQADVNAWQANYGSGNPSTAGTNAVPEPNSSVVLMSALAWIGLAVSGKRRGSGSLARVLVGRETVAACNTGVHAG